MQDIHKNLGTEPINKLIWQQSIPSIIGLVFMSLYNVIDTIFIGQTVGSLGIAGLAISFPIMGIYGAIAVMLGMGSASIISRALGANDKNKAGKILGNFFSMVVLFSFALTVGGIIFLEPLLHAFGSSDIILPYAYEYAKIIILGIFFFIFSIASADIIRAQGNARYAMFTMIVPMIINIVLDYLFIIVWNWGLTGAAMATVIGQGIGALMAIIYFMTPFNSIKIHIHDFVLKLKYVKEIFIIGSSSFFRAVVKVGTMIIFNHSLLFYGGDIAIAAFGILAKVMMFTLMPMVGFIHGLQPVLGYNYGAKKFKRAKESIINAIIKVTAYSLIIFIPLVIFPEYLVSIFTDEKDLIELSSTIITITFIMLPIIGFQHIASGIYQTMGKPKMAIFLSLLRSVILLIPLVLILPKFFGLYGIFMAYPIADVLGSFINGYFLRKEFKLLEGMEK
ncbi:MAG: MATE family efflux transporter [Candidatus Gracilibacteria bacterium]